MPLRARVGLLVMLIAAGCSNRKSGSSGTDVMIDPRPDGGRDAGASDLARDGGSLVPDGGGADTAGGCTLPPVGADLNRDFDVHLATVSGTITLAGAPLPDSPLLSTRGNVVLRERSSGDVRTIAIGAAGAATFSASMFAGTYDVSFEASASAALVGVPVAGKTRLASAVPIAGTPTLTYDLRLITVTGAVTAGGAALPDSPGLTTRGNVVFRDRVTGDARILSVGATGAGNFSGSLFPGVYDVSFETVSGAALVGLPSSAETRVASALTLDGATTAPAPLAYDVQVASVTGSLTAAGGVLPDSPTLATRGNLILRAVQSGDVRTFAVPAVGAASYAGLLFAGTYDVSFQTPALAAGLVGLPSASTTRLASGVAVAAGAATLGYDLKVASVAGTITAGSAPLPDSPGLTARGSVRFVERSTGLANAFTVGATGPATFGGALFAGNYDVAFVSSSADDLVGLPPRGSTRVATAVAIGGAATPSYDLAVVTVSGSISSHGVPLPSSPALTTRGSAVFRDRETGAATSLALGASGPGTFAGLLFASSYDVTFETPDSPALMGLPAGAATRLASNLAVSAATAAAPFVWDAPVITVAGRVTLDGAALPDSPALATRGNVVFRDKLSGDVRALALSATGPGTFNGITFAGSYDAGFETAPGAALVGLPVAAETNLDVGCLPATSCAADPSDLTGNWTFIFRDQVSWIRWNVTLAQTGDVIGGRFTAATGYTGQFDTGQRSGDTIQLSSAQNTSTCVLRVDATLSGGCFMSGTGACASGVSQSPFVGVR